MQKIILDEEIKRILPMLDEVVYNDLERNITKYGCIVPLILWGDILIDGYNRYSILERHGLPFNTVSMEFESREEMLDWVIEHQIFRRNLTPMQLSYYRGYRYNLDKKKVGNLTGRNQHSEEFDQNDHIPKPQSTARRLADQYNVAPITIRRDAKLANAINLIGETSPEVKMDILSGKTPITRKQIKQMTGDSESDINDVVNQIIEGSFKTGNTDRENPDLSDGRVTNKENTKKLIDITRTVQDAPIYPGSEPVIVKRVRDMNDGAHANVSMITAGSHMGTHADASSHFLIDSDVSIDKMDLSHYYGACRVLSFPEESMICADDLRNKIDDCKRLVIRGGGRTYLTKDAAEYIVEMGVITVVTDALSVAPPDNEIEIHKIIMTPGLAIIENVILDNVEDGEYILSAFPVKIGNCDGAPVRAVLIAND